MPAKLDLPFYTTRKYPVRMKHDDKWVNIIYFELVKNRSGIPDVTIPLVNRLHRFDFEEMDKDTFKTMYEEYLEKGEAIYEPKQKELSL